MKKRFGGVLCAVVAAMSFTAVAPAAAQSYPDRDVTLIVPFNPGGSTDPLARAFAAALEDPIGVGVNVENRAGGSATIGTNLVVSSKPDGYTIGIGDSAALIYQPMVNSDLMYKTTEDYTFLTKLADVPGMLVVAADSEYKTFDDFMEAARENPGKVRVGVSGVRSIADLVIQQLNRAADVDIATVPFTGGGGEALLAVMGGRIEAAVGYGGNTIAQINGGNLRALGVFASGDYPQVPDAISVPDDAGYNAFIPASYTIIAPNGIPEAELKVLTEAVQTAATSEQVANFANNNGFVLDPKSPEDAKAELEELSVEITGLIEWLDAKEAGAKK